MSNHKFFISVLGGAAVIVAIFLLIMAHANAAVLQCPVGTYDAGGFCKNEPTGCPYGDSIPLDSPKCAPPEAEKVDEVTPTVDEPAPVTEVSWGK